MTNFKMILEMIDNMMVILGNEQGDDDKSKDYCEREFEKAADDEAAAKDKIASLDATTTELGDSIATMAADIETLSAEIKEVDKAVATATQQRKAENAEYTTSATLNEAAGQLLEKAKQRLYKFYNPTLYKAPPKKELTMEESIYSQAGRDEFVSGHSEEAYIAGTDQLKHEYSGLVQIRSHRSRVAQPQAPETFSGPLEK